jgi:hypothetical protein
MRNRMRSFLLSAVLLLLAASTALHAATTSKKFTWESEQWIPVNLSAEGVSIKEIRFEVEGGIHWNPLRAGKGPQAFVQVRNDSDHEMKFAVAVALFDSEGSLIAATESGHIGALDPDETAEVKMTFREVKRRFFESKKGEIVLETYR